MSWNTMALFVRTEVAVDEVLDALAFPRRQPPTPLAFDPFSSALEGFAIGRVDAWIAIWSPSALELGDDDPSDSGTIWTPAVHRGLLQLSTGGAALGVVLGGVGDVHGFTWYEQGTLRRAWVKSQGEVVVELGSALEEEAGLEDESPEDVVLGVLRARVADLEVLMQAAYLHFR